MRSIAPERRSIDDPLFSDVFTSYDADEPSKNCNSNILSMPVYDTPVYDEDIFYDVVDTVKFDVIVVDLGVAVVGGTTENGYEKVIEEEVPPEAVGSALESGDGVEKVVVTKEFGVDLYNSFQHPNPRVRWASINAMVQAQAASAVLNFSKKCTPKLFPPYLDGIVRKLFLLLQNSKQMVKEGALMALFSVTKAAGYSYVINTKKNFDYEFDAVKDEVDVQVGFGILDLDHVIEVGFVGLEFDGYPKRMMHDIRNRNWFVKEEVRDGEDDDDDHDKADSRIDSRTSLFQEGEYDAVEDKTWRLRKIYFEFYLFPS